MTGCPIHGEAFTYGCPGCLNFLDDLSIAEVVRERIANDTGKRLTLDELAAEVGFTEELARLRAQANEERP